MRVRNIAGVEELLRGSNYYVDLQEGKTMDFEVFTQKQPIHLEIGMGKGKFLKTLAEKNPQVNYIGMEKSKELIWKVCKLLEGSKLDNIKVMSQRAEDIETLFQLGSIERIYLNFSDPWPKARHDKRRLTHHLFLQRYLNILSKTGEIHFKTDSLELFEFSLEEFKGMKGLRLREVTYDLHKTPPTDNVMTEYEEKFVRLGKAIYKCIAVVEE